MKKELSDALKERGLTLIEKEDSFCFRCTCCGACCRNREDILLNIQDIIRIQKYLRIDLASLIQEYCEMYIGPESKLPIIRLRPKGTNKICPFLYKGKCRIHEVKPTVCALYPLGRVNGVNADRDSKEISYVIQEVTCGAKDQKNLVSEWIKDLDSKENLLIINKWNELIGKISLWIRELDFNPSAQLYSLIAQLLYDNYELEEDLAKQLDKRMEIFDDIDKNI